jgi:ElaB/YqjD/DUF883 family membrane-anchored ribosome-binding protein
MKMDGLTQGDGYKVATAHHDFSGMGLEKLQTLQAEIDDLVATLRDVARLGGADAQKQATKLIRHLRAFEPSVTMIGQVKSGKTSLVNAMVGHPQLLPVDVNPWTSVVTSLHLNAQIDADAPTAIFQFFDQGEWDYLIENGGRIGELSARAGADDEMNKIRAQITQMRDKTKARLGRKFELLLGQRHSYADFNDDLVQRYVCTGDDFDDLDGTDQQGRFADITKSAALYLTARALPLPICLRDTPGVNDTFMMREQITINALRDSRICVLVLSAHQALSAMDMGLIRLIANVKSREVVIFVNRIDELSDPANQVPEIRASILRTLADHGGPADPQVIFGSAYWGQIALADRFDTLAPDSAEALFNWAEASLTPENAGFDGKALVWHLSGIPQLYQALSDRIAEGSGAEMLAEARKRALNLVASLRAMGAITTLRLDGGQTQVMPKPQLMRHLARLEADALRDLTARLDDVFTQFSARVDGSHQRFLDRALQALLQHLDAHGTQTPWQYNPEGLRILLRTSYQVMQRNVAAACDQVFAAAADDLAQIYRHAFGVAVENFTIKPPAAPRVPAPVSLGQTIALDLQKSWWKGWWGRRKGYRAYASGFHDLIAAETAPMVADLTQRQAVDIRALAEDALRGFLAEQRAVLTEMSDRALVGPAELNDVFGITEQNERAELFAFIYDELSAQTAASAQVDRP